MSLMIEVDDGRLAGFVRIGKWFLIRQSIRIRLFDWRIRRNNGWPRWLRLDGYDLCVKHGSLHCCGT